MALHTSPAAGGVAVTRYDFEHCYVLEIPEEHRMETHYQDGSVASGVPQDTDEYRATAQALGYGEDVWAMTREHEILHTALAELCGEHHSGALWAQAHKPNGYQFDVSRMPKRGQEEEERLFRFQRLLNRMRNGAQH